MKITSELGLEIITRLKEYLDVDINIMDLSGKIVASTNESRINEIHSGAITVIQTNKELILHDRNLRLYPNTKPGVNLPIIHREKTAGVVGVSGNVAETSRIAGLIRVSVEIVLEQIFIQRQVHFKEVQWHNWLHQLLHPGGYDSKKLMEETVYSLKVADIDNSWQVLVLAGRGVGKEMDEISTSISLPREYLLFMLPFTEDEIVIALDASYTAIHQLAHKLTSENNTAGIGNPANGLQGIRQSYQQAKTALIFNQGKSHVTSIDLWKIERLTATLSDDEYSNICSPYEQALRAMDADYQRTVDLYLKTNFSMKKTAQILHIHRNTLLYRLDQVKEKVELDPRSFHDAFLIKVILSKILCNRTS